MSSHLDLSLSTLRPPRTQFPIMNIRSREINSWSDVIFHGQRQVDNRGRALPLHGDQSHLSSMVFDDLLNDAQPEACTGDYLARGVAGAEESGEQLSLIVGRNTDATVLAGDSDPASILVDRAPEGHQTSRAAELDGVGNNVDDGA